MTSDEGHQIAESTSSCLEVVLRVHRCDPERPFRASCQQTDVVEKKRIVIDLEERNLSIWRIHGHTLNQLKVTV